jgi:putative transposase
VALYIGASSAHSIVLKMSSGSWQEGFGAFSYSHSQLSTVIRYIQNQQEHHERKSFSQEYVELLKRFNVPHDQRYIFQPVEPD